MSDYMEYGDSHNVGLNDGWLKNTETGYVKDPQGNVYDSKGELIFSVDKDDLEEDDDYDR